MPQALFADAQILTSQGDLTMPDPTVTPTDQTTPLDAGHTTSEWKATKVQLIIGAVLQAIGATLTAVQKLSADGLIPGSPVLSLILAIAPIVLGSLQQTFAVAGYMTTRQEIKIAALEAAAKGAASGGTGAGVSG